MDYSLQQFEADVEGMKPRVFDTWILPAFMLFFAVKSKNAMGLAARRMLFTAGVYMVMRNYAEYKTAVLALKRRLDEASIPPEATV